MVEEYIEKEVKKAEAKVGFQRAPFYLYLTSAQRGSSASRFLCFVD